MIRAVTALLYLAERKIEEAIARGELDDLPGQGRPLALDDDVLVPQEVRAAYRILKNAGCIPPEATNITSAAALERIVLNDSCESARSDAVKKLALMRVRIECRYHEKTVRRLTR